MNNDSANANENWVEGKDYLTYQRVRIMDRTGFSEPQEAYSLLLPQDWNSGGDIIWIGPGQPCAGTNRRIWAGSPDGKYTFDMLPNMLYSWDPNASMMYQGGGNSLCQTGQPMNAETYLRHILVRELGGAQVLSVEPNAAVVQQMQLGNDRARMELMQYGAAQVWFDQTALNAILKWNDGTEGMLTLGATITTGSVPNVYTGAYTQIYTTQITQRTIFRYPSADKEQAKHLFGTIMSSFRTNPAWNDAVNSFWYQARQQSHTVHVGRIAMIDAETRRIGEQAIRNGQDRLRAMEQQARSWEQSHSSTQDAYKSTQNSQDYMHKEFVKTIREVENYQDVSTGQKYEMSSGYDHAWSRGDGTSFVVSNNPNFNPASVFQDQNWKEMRKVL